MAEVYGGRAGLKSVTFYNDSYVSEAKLSDIEIKMACIERRNVPLLQKLEKIPFLRGILILLESLLINRKLRIYFMVCLVLNVLNLLFSKPVAIPVMYVLAGQFITILSAITIIRCSTFANFHGAEHMVYNAHLKGIELTIENVKKMSRVSEHCGTNFFLIFAVVSLLMMILFPATTMLNILLSVAISHEIFRLDTKHFFLKPVYWLGSMVQQYLVTAEPTDKQIETSIVAMKTLLTNSMEKRQ